MYLDSWNDTKTRTYRKFRPDFLCWSGLINLGSSVVRGGAVVTVNCLWLRQTFTRNEVGCEDRWSVMGRSLWSPETLVRGINKTLRHIWQAYTEKWLRTKQYSASGVHVNFRDHCLEFHLRLKEVICTAQSSDKTRQRGCNTLVIAFYFVSEWFRLIEQWNWAALGLNVVVSQTNH